MGRDETGGPSACAATSHLHRGKPYGRGPSCGGPHQPLAAGAPCSPQGDKQTPAPLAAERPDALSLSISSLSLSICSLLAEGQGKRWGAPKGPLA